MSDFIAFFQLGVGHIVDVGALDHILFLVALAVVYRPRDWRDALAVISAFTIGHSVSLALAVTNTLVVQERMVEFLIPLTIVATAVENLVGRHRSVSAEAPTAMRSVASSYRPLLAGIFGLVHGAGFAGYLKRLFVDSIALPLLGFNLGIEAGQILVLVGIAMVLFVVDALLRRAQQSRRLPGNVSVLRLRVIGLSVAIGLVASVWAVERRPW